MKDARVPKCRQSKLRKAEKQIKEIEETVIKDLLPEEETVI